MASASTFRFTIVGLGSIGVDALNFDIHNLAGHTDANIQVTKHATHGLQAVFEIAQTYRQNKLLLEYLARSYEDMTITAEYL